MLRVDSSWGYSLEPGRRLAAVHPMALGMERRGLMHNVFRQQNWQNWLLEWLRS